MHQKRSQAPTWANDTLEQSADDRQPKSKKKAAVDDYLNFDSDESEDEEDEDEEKGW